MQSCSEDFWAITRIFLIVLSGLLVCSCVKAESQQNTSQTEPASEPYAFDGSSLSKPKPSWPEEGLPERMREIMEQAPRIQIFAVETCPDGGTTLTPNESGKFQGCKVLRQAKVTDAEQKKKLVTRIISAVEPSDRGAACFNPRHGIRAEHDGKRVELLICFECENFRGASSLGSFAGGFSLAAEKPFEQFLNRK